MDNSYITWHDLQSRYYTRSLSGHIVIFGPSVFYIIGPSVINSVIQFSIDLALRIRHNGPVQFVFCVLWLNIVNTMVLFIPHSGFF